MGWYAANDGSIRSKGTMYFVVHPHGLDMSGRWVGLGYDDQIMTGFASMAHSREESEETMARLIHSGGEVARVSRLDASQRRGRGGGQRGAPAGGGVIVLPVGVAVVE
jgi:hypothetical protein